MRSNLIALTAILVSGSSLLAAEPPLAWITFEEQAVQEYDNVPYLWLGEQPIYLMIDVPPADGHVIDLLWGRRTISGGRRSLSTKNRSECRQEVTAAFVGSE